jgi:alkanesulfonate monooxygenase SsuD/methylene tetrahydromethanopterin reductase-like flavin-dependent oxidoreductase (luciferase family)
MDEELAIIRGLSAGGYFSFHREIFHMPAVKIAPIPTEPVPILVGGHNLSKAAVGR